MALTPDELRGGVRFWTNRTRWNRDFHNGFYEQLATENPRGDFSAAWWAGFLPHLREWRAMRGRGSSTRELTARFMEAERSVRDAWDVLTPHLDRDITEVSWEDVCALPDAVRPIRASSVFRSKFCHFLLPRLFPPVDYFALGRGGLPYRTYFHEVQAEWAGTDSATQHDLIGVLSAEIERRGRPVVAEYPTVNKIVELCLIGRRFR